MSYPKPVPYVRLGNSGLKISKIILGFMGYGDPKWQGWIKGEKEAIEVIKYAYDAGITTFDTSDTYSNGLSEVILGKAIRELNIPREDVVIMTKMAAAVGRDLNGGMFDTDPDSHGYVNQWGLSRKHIFHAVKDTLERLGVDYVDVMQCHRFDPATPIEETMQAFHDLVKAGYVRYIGMNSCYTWQFHVMQNYAITHNLTPFIVMQDHYNLLYREEEREMMPSLKHFGVGQITWSPLARGLLTRPWKDQNNSNRPAQDPWSMLYNRDSINEEIVNRVEGLAKKKGCKMAQIALAWNMAKSTAPILGVSQVSNIQDAIDALKIKLSDEEMKYLEEPYVPRPVAGHW